MSNQFENTASRLIGNIVSRAGQHWLVTILLAVSTATACGWYTSSHIRINMDTADMLSDRLAWRPAYNDFKQTFPFLSDTIIVVVDARTPDLASEAADRLASALRQNKIVFSDIFHPAVDHFFQFNQLLYLNLEELQTLNDEVSRAQPFLARLAADPSLYGLLGLLSEAATSIDDKVEPRLIEIFHSVGSAIDNLLSGDQTPMPWQQLFLGDALTPKARVVFTVKPKIDFGSIQPGATAVSAIRQATENLSYEHGSGLRVRLTGAAALSYDELNSVMRGTKRAGFLALALVAVCLFVGLRSLSLVTATLLTLVIGLLLTASFAVAAVGTLNMISIAFAVLYVGLGVDFAIHVCLRYRELPEKTPKPVAISEASRHVGPSLFLCALTTAISFFAFIPTAYRGVAELGLISGVGMFIGLACSLTVLPALLAILPRPSDVTRSSARRHYLADLPRRKAGTILAIAAVFGVASTFVLPTTHFDHNPIHLNDPNAESVTTFLDLLESTDEPPYSISLIADSAAKATEITGQLLKHPTVGTVTTALDFVPSDQEQKLGYIDDLALILGGRVALGEARPIVVDEILERLAELRVQSELLTETQPEALQTAASSLAKTLKHLKSRTEGPDFSISLFTSLEKKLLSHFTPQIDRLNMGLDAFAFDLDALPENFRRRWVTKDERFRLEIYPKQNLDTNENLRAFVTAVQAITGPIATGIPIINVEASRAVIDAFLQAFLSAFIVIALTLYFILRKVIEVLVVMIPILLAGLLTAASVTLAGIPFNFANVIALPLLMGIGVDSALHMLHRHKFLAAADGPLLTTSTARAVLFSALTTTASFGNLAFSPHAGTASMGILLTIGLGLTLLCMLIVMPALLTHFVEARSPAR